MQGLDVTSGGLVNEARKESENPLTITSRKTMSLISHCPKKDSLELSMVWCMSNLSQLSRAGDYDSY